MTTRGRSRSRRRDQRLLDRRYDGVSINQLCLEFGLTKYSVRRILSEVDPLYGKEIPKNLVHRQMKKWLTVEKKAEIKNLLGPTPNPNDLSRNYGISRVLALSVTSLLRHEHKNFLKKEKLCKLECQKRVHALARRLFEAGASKRFISRRCGLSRLELSRVLGDG